MLAPGFPSDDACALQQRASGEANLDIYYSNQYVENECNMNMLAHKEYVIFEHTPLIAGTIVGTVNVDGEKLCSFIVQSNGEFSAIPADLDDFETYFDAKKCSINLTTGEMTLAKNNVWAVDVKKKDYDLYTSYEYNLEVQQQAAELNHIKCVLEFMKKNNMINDYSIDRWGKVGVQKNSSSEFLFVNVNGFPCDDLNSLMMY